MEDFPLYYFLRNYERGCVLTLERQEVISLLRKVTSDLKEISVRLNELSYTISTAIGMIEDLKPAVEEVVEEAAERLEEVAVQVEEAAEPAKEVEAVAADVEPSVVEAESAVTAAPPPPKPEEERLVRVSERIRKPIEDRFIKLENLIEEGTRPIEIAEELLKMKSWIYEEYPSFLPIVYHIDMWSRKLKSYSEPALTPSDKARLLFSVGEWKERMLKAKPG